MLRKKNDSCKHFLLYQIHLSLVSKLFEKVLEMSIGKVKYDTFQFGGSKGMGTIDNWFILIAIRNEFRRLKKNMYLFFGDLVKCFN